ncbi:hypothetical protein G7Y89_g3602 [Cudoniella acicularis]|uniref:Uncharacterized protein n=1 Tax=Cudoniella acicularis TaxID=354080 RepID=A0A8H4RR17_9HELO|nr:hypothetical protein G7Y89_g3602 [Cudoniella acicularis]
MTNQTIEISPKGSTTKQEEFLVYYISFEHNPNIQLQKFLRFGSTSVPHNSEEVVKASDNNMSSTYSTPSNKYASCDLSGSVYLIDGNGQMPSLPIPLHSPRDPLNWAAFKRTRAFLTLVFFSIVGLVLMQGLSLMFVELAKEFKPDRPHAIAMMWSLVGFFTLGLFSLVPQMASSGTNWRTFYYYWSIPTIVTVLLAFFFYPETYFLRPAVAFNGHVLVQSSTEKVKIYEDWEQVPGGKILPGAPSKTRLHGFLKELRFWGTTRGGWRAMLSCHL